MLIGNIRAKAGAEALLGICSNGRKKNNGNDEDLVSHVLPLRNYELKTEFQFSPYGVPHRADLNIYRQLKNFLSPNGAGLLSVLYYLFIELMNPLGFAAIFSVKNGKGFTLQSLRRKNKYKAVIDRKSGFFKK